ncbi:hypothetical protein BJF78_03000 [Pseudonocardia sp. CNS-139]|nr:hypothetical protein BJF78_03000 [Pseudonocardia sp. CNS-139]
MTRLIGTAALSLRLLRLGGRRAVTSAALVGTGIAVGTMLLAVAFGALHGWDARDARTGWRAEPSAQVSVIPDAVAGRPMERVEVAAAPDAPAPPGLPRTPAPGEVVGCRPPSPTWSARSRRTRWPSVSPASRAR